MRHIVLDEDLKYSPHYNTFYFKLGNGHRSSYFKVNPEIKVVNNECELDTFRVVQSRRTGYYSIVPGRDTSQRCLVFFNCKCDNPYERVELDTEVTTCDIIEILDTYTSDGLNEIKVVAIISPRKPFSVRYYNTKTGKSRYEYLLYDFIHGTVDRKVIDEPTRNTIRKEKVFLSDSDFDTSKFHVTKEMLANLTDDDIKRAEEYFNKYYSPIKDA